MEDVVGPTVPALPPLTGEPFLGLVPDFIPIDTQLLLRSQVTQLRRGSGRPRRAWQQCVMAALRLAVWQQKQFQFAVADVFVRQCAFGADYPSNWRRMLSKCLRPTREGLPGKLDRTRARHQRLQMEELEILRRLESDRESIQLQRSLEHVRADLQRKKAELVDLETLIATSRFSGCHSACQYWDAAIPHQHFEAFLNIQLLGALSEFLVRTDGNVRIFNWDIKTQDGKSLMRQLQKSNRVTFAYLPAMLFGASPCVGLSASQRRLIQGVVRERTRIVGRGARPGVDRIELVQTALVPAASGSAQVVCPYLDGSRSYVSFNNNLKRDRGRGYAILGQNDRGWLHRAGYAFPVGTAQDEKWKAVRRLLLDLRSLTGSFQFVVAGLSRRGEWKSLDEMLEMLRMRQGRRWLDSCRLRIYAPQNYLEIWRHWFASKLGFSHIPGGTWPPPVEQALSPVIDGRTPKLDSAEAVRVWLDRAGLTQKQLATAIGWSAAQVNHQLVGRRRWSAKFQSAVMQFAQQTSALERGSEATIDKTSSS